MIPIKLELKNFLSYGDSFVKVDFSDHSLICLSGKNGNGKSALLDAITWALWGVARKVSGSVKADAGLIRLGQTRMVVSLEFFSGGQKYRVRREYAKTHGKPYAALYIDIFDVTKKSFFPLTEKTIRQTQAKVEEIIGLDFETFVNSAFLRQGQSNEFSKKTSKERKQILANILGLSRYDKLNKLAVEKMRKFNEESKVLQKIQEQAIEELKQEEEFGKKLKETKKELKIIDEGMKKTGENLNKKEKEKILIFEKKYKIEQIEKEKNKLLVEIKDKKKQLLEYVKFWKKIHYSSLKTEDFEVLEKKLDDFLKKDKIFGENQRKEIFLQEKIIKNKEGFQNRVATLKKEFYKQLQEKILEFEKLDLSNKQIKNLIKQKEDLIDKNKKKQEEINKNLEKITKELSQDGDHKNFAKIKSQFEKRRIFYQNLVDRGNWAQREFKDLFEKKNIAQDKNNPSCPLCQSVLTVKRKQFLARTLVKQEQFLKHRLDRIKRLLKNLKVKLFEQHNLIKKLELQDEKIKQFVANKESFIKNLKELKIDEKRELIELNVLRVRMSAQEKDIKISKKSLEEKQKEEKEILKKDSFVQKIESDLKKLEKEKKDLNYDKKEHEKILEEIDFCKKKLKDSEDFKKQLAQQEQRKKIISNLCAEIRNYKNQDLVLEKTKEKISFDPEKEKKIEEKIKILKNEQENLNKKKEKFLQEKGSFENKIERFEKLKKDSKDREKEISKTIEESREYGAVAGMFGRDGIQALLIEQAIPEIEHEANSLLSKLTDNKSQIFIESLRDLKKGGVKESLDIHISDSSGIRPYEMFSGGEAFRIDFALRIAISKLLARRAGTALQTLIIDEGFGSQDDEGLQRLMDAIYAIQKDFLKIIVVSHLPIFKNNFPVHFIVSKDSMGSFVQVEERG